MEVGEIGWNGTSVTLSVVEELKQELEDATVPKQHLEERTVAMMVRHHWILKSAMCSNVQVLYPSAINQRYYHELCDNGL